MTFKPMRNEKIYVREFEPVRSFGVGLDECSFRFSVEFSGEIRSNLLDVCSFDVLLGPSVSRSALRFEIRRLEIIDSHQTDSDRHANDERRAMSCRIRDDEEIVGDHCDDRAIEGAKSRNAEREIDGQSE